MQEAPGGVLHQAEAQGFRPSRDKRVSHDRMPQEIRLSLPLPQATRCRRGGHKTGSAQRLSALNSIQLTLCEGEKNNAGSFSIPKFSLAVADGISFNLLTSRHYCKWQLAGGGLYQGNENDSLERIWGKQDKNIQALIRLLQHCRHLKGSRLNPLVLCKSLNISEDKWLVR